MISRASAAVGTPPRELLILAMPLMPTNAYIGPIGGCAPKTSRMICPPTTYDEPGDAWSTPEGSNTTPSYAPRIGQATLPTPLPRSDSDSRTVPVFPHAQAEARPV